MNNYPTKKGQKFRLTKGDIGIVTVASFSSSSGKEFDTLEECQAQSNTDKVIVKNKEYGGFSDLKYTEKI